jgi:hypothetical protein
MDAPPVVAICDLLGFFSSNPTLQKNGNSRKNQTANRVENPLRRKINALLTILRRDREPRRCRVALPKYGEHRAMVAERMGA